MEGRWGSDGLGSWDLWFSVVWLGVVWCGDGQ